MIDVDAQRHQCMCLQYCRSSWHFSSENVHQKWRQHSVVAWWLFPTMNDPAPIITWTANVRSPFILVYAANVCTQSVATHQSIRRMTKTYYTTKWNGNRNKVATGCGNNHDYYLVCNGKIIRQYLDLAYTFMWIFFQFFFKIIDTINVVSQ